MTVQCVQVVAAVIRRPDGRVLLAQRPQHKHQGGLWEFPGGKVETGETEVAALQRELQEELGLWPEVLAPLIRIRHDYPDKSVELSVWQVTQWRGESYADALEVTRSGREGQPVLWVAPQDFQARQFPAANAPILAAARLPAIWRITPALDMITDVQAWARQRLPIGSGAPADVREGWLLRLPGWTTDRYVQAAEALIELLAREQEASSSSPIALCLHGDPEVLQRVPSADGFHFNRQQVRQLQTAGQVAASLRSRTGQLFSAAAHDDIELASALAVGVDSAWLSPVLATASHPDATPLGWSSWSMMLAKVPMPVYALGGVSPAEVSDARRWGGQGVAGISRF